MMSWTRPSRVVAGGLLLAALAGGPVRAQEFPDLPPLPLESRAVVPAPPPPAPAAAVVAAPPGFPDTAVVGPAHVSSDGPHVVPRPCLDLSDRETRRFWHRFQRQDKCLGYPEEFVARPLGAAVYTANRVQVANGEAAQMVLYDFDFDEGTNKLNPRGQDRLAEIIKRLPVTFHPVIIERTPRNPGLDEVRRLAVLAQLSRGPFPVPSERIVVGPPLARGLDPEEAEIVHQTRLRRTSSFGPPISQGSFTSGGSTTGGGSTGGGVSQ